ncbi:MAG: Ku protein [Acidobacteria bacterium]|nr:Ku protein [Acidobacteriota bacterium]
MAASVWKGHLTFGLVSFPVMLSSAARPLGIRFNLLHGKDNSRIKEVMYCRAEDQPVVRTDLVKGYEYDKDQYVVIEDEEIKKVAPKTAKVMEVLEFVKAEEVDPVYLESSYYVAPGEGGEKPYALFFDAMRSAQYFGVAKIAMHNREHIVVLRPGQKGLLLHTMYFQDEIRQSNEFQTDTSQVKPKELELAKSLIESLAAPFEPGKYHDTYRENLTQMIQEKISGHKVVATPEPHVAPVIDIMEALKRSLAQRKPPQPAKETHRKPAAEARPAKKKVRRAS